MKKFLLSTSAIVGVGLIAGPAGAAEKITLGLGGSAETYVGFKSAEDDQPSVRSFDSFGILTDKEVHFSGSTKLDNGITISVRIELEGDESATTIDESYISITSDTLGMVRIGGDDMVQGGAYVGPDRGISGDYDNWIAESNATTNDNAYDTGNAGDSPMIAYWTPRIAGFQGAVSYSPNTGNTGGSSPNFNTVNNNHSAYSLSLTWREEVGGVAVNSQVGYYREGGGNGTIHQENINVGLRLAYQGFDVGFAWGRFIQPAVNGDNPAGNATTKDGRTLAASVSYADGPWKAGIWVLDHENAGASANTGDDETRVYSVFGEYSLSDGVLLQGMIFKVDYDEETNADANEMSGGLGVVAGMKLSF
jgi:hypothetical protein